MSVGRWCAGAAVLMGSGRIYAGCNVENASYGLCNCAERTAIFTGASALAAPGGGGTARSTSAADVAIQLSYARLVVIVPGGPGERLLVA